MVPYLANQMVWSLVYQVLDVVTDLHQCLKQVHPILSLLLAYSYHRVVYLYLSSMEQMSLIGHHHLHHHE